MAPQPFAVTGPVDGRSCPVFTRARNVSSSGRGRPSIEESKRLREEVVAKLRGPLDVRTLED